MTIAIVEKVVVRLVLCATFAFIGVAAGHGGGTMADIMRMVLREGDSGEPIGVWGVFGTALVLCSMLTNRYRVDNVLVLIGCACQSIALSMVYFSSYAELSANVTLGVWMLAVLYIAYRATGGIAKGSAPQKET